MASEHYRRVVVKVGTAVLTGAGEEVDRAYLETLVEQLCALRQKGVEVALVTSGAIRSGMKPLGLARLRSLRESQAAAAVGQGILMHHYQELFHRQGYVAGQILLTRDDFAHRERYLNARNTMLTLLERGAVPIINENDTVAVEEIEFGDNDQLAAQVSILLDADLLLLLTDVEGFYRWRGGRRELVRRVERITPDLEAEAGGPSSGLGQGGMVSKLLAARMATSCGIAAIVAHGRTPQVILRAVQGEEVGTFFQPHPSRWLRGRRRWIAFSGRPRGSLVVDAGAKEKLLHEGKSLLPAGVKAVEGNFHRGDIVRIVDEMGEEFARGLVNYPAAEVRRIQGHHSREIPRLLGYAGDPEVVHRDHLILLSRL